MKKYLIILSVFFSTLSYSQDLNWYTDVKEAINVSTKEKKPILLFFTGSDWCGWCIRLQKEVLTTPEFAKWALDNVVLVEIDFPNRKEQSIEIKNQNKELQQAFSIQGFPTIYFANVEVKDEKVNFKGLGSTGYIAGGPIPWLEKANNILKSN